MHLTTYSSKFQEILLSYEILLNGNNQTIKNIFDLRKISVNLDVKSICMSIGDSLGEINENYPKQNRLSNLQIILELARPACEPGKKGTFFPISFFQLLHNSNN